MTNATDIKVWRGPEDGPANQCLYDMVGYTDMHGDHPGDGIPRLLNFGGSWTLWYMVNDGGDFTSQAFGDVPEEMAVALSAQLVQSGQTPASSPCMPLSHRPGIELWEGGHRRSGGV